MTDAEFFEDDNPGLNQEQSDDLILKLDGFEGPIDLLLTLARKQKVDLTQISILQLVHQYLEFVEATRKKNLDLAAEYLVMAAWLAFLKSRLLIPRPDTEDEEPDSEAVAAALAFQLRRLEAIKAAAEKLGTRDRLNRDIFARGAPDKVTEVENITFKADLYTLLKAYGDMHRRTNPVPYTPKHYNLFSLEEAYDRLTSMLGALPKNGNVSVWTTLASFLNGKEDDPLRARSILASTLSASLELVKRESAEIRQDGLFKPIYIRAVKSELEGEAR